MQRWNVRLKRRLIILSTDLQETVRPCLWANHLPKTAAPWVSQTSSLFFLPRCLMTPLDHLAITNCQLTELDLTHLSQCPNIHQLKGLDLSGVTMTDFSPKILRILLEQVAATLQELNLEQCGITESQLESILPVLSCCSQLRTFSLCGNVLSMAIMEKLLSHITGLINHSFVWITVSKVIYLLFNTLCRFVIAFLLRSKCLHGCSQRPQWFWSPRK